MGPAPSPISAIQSVVSGRAVWISLALIAASAFIYAPVRHHDFVAWDDPVYVSENLRVGAGLTWSGVRWALTTGYMANWHPLTWLSYMLDVQLFGAGAGAQLLTNLLLHALNALLLFGFLHAMTGALGRSGFVAALFAVHPLHVESVAWVSERKDVLSTLFGLLALWAYLEYTRRTKRTAYLIVVLFFALSLMAKPMLVTLPFVMLLLDYWPLGRLSPDSDRHAVMRLVREKLPLFLMVVACSIITVVTQLRAGAVSALATTPLDQRVANALAAYVGYIGKMLWPSGLAAFYPIVRLTSGAAIWSAAVLGAVSYAVLRWSRKRPYLTVGWLWYLGTLLPVIGLVQVGSQAMADRYTYFPSIGLFVILAWGVRDLFAERPHGRRLLPAAAGILVLVCAVAARAQVAYWTNSLTLWTHALDVDPGNDVAQYLLGDALVRGGRVTEALPHYHEALRLKPDNAEAHDSLGFALASQGKLDDAIPEYTEALRLKPAFAEAHANLGQALADCGKIQDAIAQFEEALRINPELINARNDLGIALANEGKSAEAIAQFWEVLRLTPTNPDAHNNLGILLAGQGRIGKAVEQFSEALRLRPDFALARENLKIALAKQGNTTNTR
jgi:Flp pilus assembly protein TadD